MPTPLPLLSSVNGDTTAAAAATPETATNGDHPPVDAISSSIQDARDESKGAVVHHFDASTPAEDKAAQALSRGVAALAPVEGATTLQSSAAEIQVDTPLQSANTQPTTNGSPSKMDDSSVLAVVAGGGSKETPLVETKKEAGDILDPVEKAEMPGTLSVASVKAREIPDWFQIGWSGQQRDDPFATPQEIKYRSFVADFINESYYGDWYHDGGIILFAVLASHFATIFGGGFASLAVILAICSTYYTTSTRRMRRNARDDQVREVAKKGLKVDVESATWLNLFMSRFWIIYEPVLSATIVASVDQVLSLSTPAFLDSIRMTTFTLGTKPPHIDHVRTFADTADDIVMMEWKVSFTPSDILDMTMRQQRSKVNPKIVLNIRIGSGVASVGKNIIVEDFAFEGTMRVKIKLMNNFPHVQLVDLSFTQPPTFDFVLKPVGFDLSILPGLKPFIDSQVHATLGPMLYDPNVFTLNLEQLMSGVPIDTACGILALTIYGGRGIKTVKLGGGSPDPYISISIAQRAELARTAIKKNTANPNWNETKYILINNLNESLTMVVRDWNELRKDQDLGLINFDLSTLKENGQQEGITSAVEMEGKSRGEVKFDAVYFPVLTARKIDGVQEPIPETLSGIVRFTVHQAKDLDPQGGQINPFAQITLNDSLVHRSQTLKRTPNPVYEHACEFLVTNKSTAVIGVLIRDDSSIASDPLLGHVRVKLRDLLAPSAKEHDWYPLDGAKSGRVRISAEWKPVMMHGLNSAGVYSPPIGILRLWVKRGRDLKNVEALAGKSDPYLRVLRNGIIIQRTVVINNDLYPTWDEILYVPVHNAKDAFTLEAMDYQHLTTDRPLGSTLLQIASLVKEGSDKVNAPWISTGKNEYKEALRSGSKNVVKGSIEFEAEFFPCVHLKDSLLSFDEVVSSTITEEIAEEEAEQVSTAATVASTAAKVSGIAPSFRSSPALADLASNSPTLTNDSGTRPSTPNSIRASSNKAEGLALTRSEILSAQSGILIFQILSGRLSKKARVEVFVDSTYWPSFSTEMSRSTTATIDEIGEVFVRELDVSTITLKLNTAEKDTREEIIGSYTTSVTDFLETCLYKTATFTLTDSNGGSRSSLRISAKFIPVEITLEPRESINNSGVLRVDLLDAKGLPAVDRSGKSDPYVVFELNGVKVHKSEIVKKTLAPSYHENFEMSVPSRFAANFGLTIYDWDRVGVDRKLCSVSTIDLTGLEPMEQKEVVLDLRDETGQAVGGNAGSIRLRFVFRPGFVFRSRQATSTFSGAGKSLSSNASNLAGAGVGAGTAVVGGVVGGVGTVGKGVFSGVKALNPLRDDRRIPPVPAVPASVIGDVVPLPAVFDGGPQTPPKPTSSTSAAGRGPGSLRVTVVSVDGVGDVEEKKFVLVKSNGKTLDSTRAAKGDRVDFNECFTVKTSTDPLELSFTLVHKKLIGSDKPLGSFFVQAFDHLRPPTDTTASVVGSFVGHGSINVELDWSPALDDDQVSLTRSVSPSATRKSLMGSLRRAA